MKKTITLTAAALLLAVSVGGAFAQTAIAPKLPAPGEAPAGSPVAKHGQLSVSGSKIKDKDGNDVVLRGLSFFWSAAGEGFGGAYYSDDVVGWLAHDWKVSVLRAAMSVEVDGGGGGGIGWIGDKSQANTVRTVVEAAIRRGIYVIIDWHSHKAHSNTSAAQTFFTEMATAYGAYPNVIYEIYNEPMDEYGGNWGNILPYANSVISSIRSKDNKNIIVVGSPAWSQQPNGGDGVTSSANVAYSVHFYANTHSSTGGVGTNTTGALSNGRAVIATEFGTCNASGNGGYNESATDAWFTLLETNKVSWVNWSITSKDETASIFTNGGTGRAGNASNWSPTSKPALSTSGAYINGKLKSYNSAYFNTAYAIAATAGAGGRVTKSPDKATYDFGDKVTITAVPDDGYEFAMWEGDAVGVGTTISYRVVGLNVSAKATFVQGSMVKNGFFVSNIANWVGSAATISHEDGALKAVVSSPSSGSAVRQGSINMVTGRKYELTFKAKAASGTAVITPRMTNTNLDRDYIKEPQAITLTGDWKEYKVEFMMCFRNNQNVLLSDDKAVLYFACGANGVQTWHLDDVVLNDVGSTPDCLAGPVAWSVRDIGRAGWSIAKFGAAWQLRGPASGAGAKAYIYDTRGKAVKSMAAADGLTLGKGMPAGSYFLVIKNSAGAEAFRSKITVVR